MSHSNATFLAPLVHSQTGEDIFFLYSPHMSAESATSRSKHSDSELGEILTQQYPPLFHAANHVPSFIRAMEQMTNMRHLTIKTPGHGPSEGHRRNIVDCALISLRISLERAPAHEVVEAHFTSGEWQRVTPQVLERNLQAEERRCVG